MTLNKTIYTCQFNSPIGTLIFRYSVIRKPVKMEQTIGHT